LKEAVEKLLKLNMKKEYNGKTPCQGGGPSGLISTREALIYSIENSPTMLAHSPTALAQSVLL
ncbi:MAG: hypothetical protein LBD44_03690, partial [Spirochaetaceae bacterium]|nr:hypothetical protein [Spirochaetaceae bacterium]